MNTFALLHRQLLIALILLTSLFLPQIGFAEEGSIGFENFRLKVTTERSYLLDAQLRYQLTEYLQKGLREGVNIISEVDIRLVKDRTWWWDKNKSLAKITAKLQYHALSQHYQVIRQDTNEHWNFKSLNAALRKMGALRSYRLPKLPKSIKSGKYHIELQATIKPDTFKFPMKIHSLFVSKYKIETSGVQWPLP